MLKRAYCRFDADVTLTCQGPVLVGSGAPSLDGPDAAPVLTSRGGQLEPCLPGSSLKGAIRSHTERIARTLKARAVCLPYQERVDRSLGAEGQAVGCGHQLQSLDTMLRKAGGTRRLQRPEAYAHSCAACRLFGSTQFGGRIRIDDAYVTDASWRFEDRDNVAIDRFTGGAASGKKFDKRVVVGATFKTHISIDNFELWQLGMLYSALLDLEDGLIPIGSGVSRGLGQVEGAVARVSVSYRVPTEHLRGIDELITDEKTRRSYDLSRWAVDTPIPLPAMTSRRGLRRIYDISDTWHDLLAPTAESFEAFVTQRDWLTQMQSFVATQPNQARG